MKNNPNTNLEFSEKKEEVITVKEIYERLVKIEASLDLKNKIDKKITNRFTWYVVFLFLFDIINMLIHLFL